MDKHVIDPVTFEVIRHKLWAIGDEQEITLKSVSGSPVVTESSDFNNGIYSSDGKMVMLGRQVLVHAGTMSSILKSVMEECRHDPGIEDGDMFIMNDPYRGAVHVQDISVLAPIFHEGELVAWFGTCAHQLDVGGIEPGSWCPTAREQIQEGLILPPVKLVERGKTRKDVWNMILANSRLPFLLGLDLRAMIAANNVAKKRFRSLIESYGLATVKGVMTQLMDASEAMLRKRLKELPDGVFRAVDFLDHDGFRNDLYKVALAVTKKDDRLAFDFDGTSKQAPGFINSSKSASIGGVLTALFPILAYDIPWNDGLLRPINIMFPKGSICDPQPPAPVGSGATGTSWVVQNAAIAALSRLVACSDSHRREAQGVTEGAFNTLNLRGRNQYGEPYGQMVVDVIGGGGAYSFKDGLDPAKGYGIAVPNIANVEWNESFAPIRYLYRQIIQDSGGPGKFRGGCAGGMAFALQDTESLDAVLVCHGVEVPNSAGVLGGFPGSCNVNTLIRGGISGGEPFQRRRPIKERVPADRLVDLGAKPGRFTIDKEDVFEYTWQGGGGYGDPLDRSPERVLNDVVNGLVSLDCARRIYGVVINEKNMELHIDGTELLRKEKKADRLALRQSQDVKLPEREGTIIGRLGEWLELVVAGDRKFVRCTCGHIFGPAGENWKKGALSRVVSPAEAGPLVKLHEELELREHLCPNCARLHSTEIALKGDPSLVEIELVV